MRTAVKTEGNKILIFWFLAAAVIALIAFYTVVINKNVVHALEMDKMELEIAKMKSHIAVVEHKLIGLRNSMDMSVAQELGLKESKDVAFVSTRTLGHAQLFGLVQ